MKSQSDIVPRCITFKGLSDVFRLKRTRSTSSGRSKVTESVLSSPTTIVEKMSQAPPDYMPHACTFCKPMHDDCDSNDSRSGTYNQRLPSYATRGSSVEGLRHLTQPGPVKVIADQIDALNGSLRELSLDIWEHPEVAFEERHAHDALTKFISNYGFTVTPHYLGLETAWKATYSRGKHGRVIGINAEMDALPGIGHACGHNLIAVSGIAVAVALKAAMDKYEIPGTIVLLGTPGEESGGGKIKLLERGAFKEIDVCIMSHPSPGPTNGVTVSPWLSLQPLEVEFFGHSAHAAYAPWEAQNALDAAFLAYQNVSVLRQQLKPTYRVHGIVSGRDWEPNVIPDYAKMRWIIRSPTWAELEGLRARILACFQAAAIASSCKHKVTLGEGYYDVRENDILGQEFCDVAGDTFGMNASTGNEAIPASTDFGNVTYVLPSITPVYFIPTERNGSNHTPQFAESARSAEAHEAAMTVSKGLAATALRVLRDEEFYKEVVASFKGKSSKL